MRSSASPAQTKTSWSHGTDPHAAPSGAGDSRENDHAADASPERVSGCMQGGNSKMPLVKETAVSMLFCT